VSDDAVQEVIKKAVADVEFRSRLFSDSETALSGYDLTEEERASLSALDEGAFDALAAEVEERISRAGLLPDGRYRVVPLP
jgi:hypothetical protein